MSVENTVLLDPWLRTTLAAVGHDLPSTLLGDIRTDPSHSLLALSDYGGIRSDLQYETYATYIVDLNAAWQVVEPLDAFKAMNGIAQRSMNFKSRKDRLRAPLIAPWIAGFAAMPGLLIVMAWDKRLRADHRARAERRLLNDELGRLGLELGADQAERLVKKIAWLSVVAHLLKPTDKLAWVSDHDELLQGALGRTLPDALSSLANQLLGQSIAALNYAPPLSDEHETLLTLPDLVAGALAQAIPAPYVPGFWPLTEDAGTNSILGSLVEFGSAFDPAAQHGRLLPLLFSLENDLTVPHVLQFRRSRL